MSDSNGTRRVALVGATPATHDALRREAGLAPPHTVGYAGREYRVYSHMRVAEATRFYASLCKRWDPGALQRGFDLAGIGDNFEIRRLKRAYQRALVLCYVLAQNPRRAVIEAGDEFDEAGPCRLLEHAVASVPSALVTFGGDAPFERAWFDEVAAADAYLERARARRADDPARARRR